LNLNKIEICGICHSALDYRKTIDVFEEWIDQRGKSHQVCVANVHTTIMCRHDKELAAIANNASLVTMDGQPLRWYANFVHKAGVKERVCGSALLVRCVEEGSKKGWKHYFLGGKPEVLKRLCSNLMTRHPGIKIVGSYSPPFRPLTDGFSLGRSWRTQTGKMDCG
jgi:N-acetylglucosaminyldiphosphoundecaprenol N-acetyl-beta-D-mannosaminyltransferase